MARSLSQRSDSGTHRRMKSVNSPGTAPNIIKRRQPLFSGETRKSTQSAGRLSPSSTPRTGWMLAMTTRPTRAMMR